MLHLAIVNLRYRAVITIAPLELLQIILQPDTLPGQASLQRRLSRQPHVML